MRGARTLGELAVSMTMLEIKCDRCGRHGRLRINRLVKTYGRDILLPDLGTSLTSDCANSDASIYERCSPCFPQLGSKS